MTESPQNPLSQLEFVKVIRDPIHGMIKVTAAELAIIESPYFQRLRRIKQLGLNYLVYPSTHHTRFEHSIGVMQVVTDIFTQLGHNATTWGTIQKEDYQEFIKAFYNPCKLKLLRFAALLHDIGHLPFSHVLEKAQEPYLEERTIPQRAINPLTDMFPGFEIEKISHEIIGVMLILSDQKIKNEIKNSGIEIKDVISLILQEKLDPFSTRITSCWDNKLDVIDLISPQLIAGNLDADRLDYLKRDKYFTGVEYGAFDYNWILSNIVPFLIKSNNEKFLDLGILNKSVSALEQFLIARYMMYKNVYYHKTVVALEEILKEIIKEIIRKKNGTNANTSKKLIAQEIIQNPAMLIKNETVTDDFVLNLIERINKESNNTNKQNQMVSIFLERKPPKLIYERIFSFEKDNINKFSKEFLEIILEIIKNFNPEIDLQEYLTYNRPNLRKLLLGKNTIWHNNMLIFKGISFNLLKTKRRRYEQNNQFFPPETSILTINKKKNTLEIKDLTDLPNFSFIIPLIKNKIVIYRIYVLRNKVSSDMLNKIREKIEKMVIIQKSKEQLIDDIIQNAL